MICLMCGAENRYGSKECTNCQQPFATFPPYLRSNHICQLQAALRDCQEGNIDLDVLGEAYGRFAELSMNFQEKWSLLDGLPLLDRLPDTLKPTFGAAISEIDKSLGSLEQALAFMDEALESQDVTALSEADEHFTDFFKICCGGCALLLDDFERLGQTGGFGAFLDVRQL